MLRQDTRSEELLNTARKFSKLNHISCGFEIRADVSARKPYRALDRESKATFRHTEK